MDPVSTVLIKMLEGIASDAVKKRATGFLERLGPSEQEKAAKVACSLFAHEFLAELEDKTPLRSAVPGYHDQVKRLMEIAAPDIAGWLQPETKDVDLSPVLRLWRELKLDVLPEG